MNFGIIGTGASLPDHIVTNDDLVKAGVDTSDEWIRTRTGIESRRIAPPEQSSSTYAIQAAQEALNNANLSPNDIDLVIVATSTPDYQGFPSTACIVQRELSIPICPAFDVSAACSGFNYALTTALSFCKSGQSKNALVIGVDCLSKILDWNDRATCVLFGDGAGAAVLSSVDNDYGVLFSDLNADGNLASILTVNNKIKNQDAYTIKDHQPYIYMEGRAVFKSAIQSVVPSIETSLQAIGIDKTQLNLLIPHQANLRIISQIQEKVGLTSDQVFSNLQKYGNTSAASIPIALHEAVIEKKISKDDIIMLLGFGAGFTWGINILRWS